MAKRVEVSFIRTVSFVTYNYATDKMILEKAVEIANEAELDCMYVDQESAVVQADGKVYKVVERDLNTNLVD